GRRRPGRAGAARFRHPAYAGVARPRGRIPERIAQTGAEGRGRDLRMSRRRQSACGEPAMPVNATPNALPDLMAAQLAVVFCGIDPGLQAAATGHHFTGPTNRFWRVIHLAGFTPQEIRPEDDHRILQYRCGLTTVVNRPTARADQLAPEEFAAAAA